MFNCLGNKEWNEIHGCKLHVIKKIFIQLHSNLNYFKHKSMQALKIYSLYYYIIIVHVVKQTGQFKHEPI